MVEERRQAWRECWQCCGPALCAAGPDSIASFAVDDAATSEEEARAPHRRPRLACRHARRGQRRQVCAPRPIRPTTTPGAHLAPLGVNTATRRFSSLACDDALRLPDASMLDGCVQVARDARCSTRVGLRRQAHTAAPAPFALLFAECDSSPTCASVAVGDVCCSEVGRRSIGVDPWRRGRVWPTARRGCSRLGVRHSPWQRISRAPAHRKAEPDASLTGQAVRSCCRAAWQRKAASMHLAARR
jgi:hypothetical protein